MKMKKILYHMLLLTYAVGPYTVKPHDIVVNTLPIEALRTQTQRNVPQDISFIIADIKYDGENLKILEFGEGPRSYFLGHEKLYGQGKIWEHLWHYLAQFKVPVWYVGNPLDTAYKSRQIAQETFASIGGEFAKNVHELKKDAIFKKLCEPEFITPENYAGIIVLRHHTMPPAVINRFKENYPHFLILDKACSYFVNNKYRMAQVMAQAALDEYKPQWQVYDKKYTSTLAQTILDDFPTVKTFVIKPLNAANGWGVNIVHKTELDAQLKLLFDTPKEILRNNTDTSINYWGKDTNQQFLVEQYVRSKPVTVRDKKYDGTMRVIMVLDYDHNTVNLTFLGGYWKLPCKALDEPGSLTEQHKSKIVNNRPSSAPISKKDFDHVKEILKTIIPRVYLKMIEKNTKARD